MKVIFLDATGTLIHLPRGVGFHYADVAGRFGWNADAGSVGKAFRALWSEMPPPETTREPKLDDDRGWWRALVDRVLDRSGARDAFDRDGYFGAVYEEFTKPGVWELYRKRSKSSTPWPRSAVWRRTFRGGIVRGAGRERARLLSLERGGAGTLCGVAQARVRADAESPQEIGSRGRCGAALAPHRRARGRSAVWRSVEGFEMVEGSGGGVAAGGVDALE